MRFLKLLIGVFLFSALTATLCNGQKMRKNDGKKRVQYASEELDKLALAGRSYNGDDSVEPVKPAPSQLRSRGKRNKKKRAEVDGTDLEEDENIMQDNGLPFHANSTGFSMPAINFECPVAQCKFAHMMSQTVFHMVVGTGHDNYFPLFAHRVCEAFQKCIKPENFRIVLQTVSDSDEDKERYMPAIRFLKQLNIESILWVGVFTADSKMVRSFQALEHDYDPNRYVYQTDFDEVPDPVTFNRAMKELKSGTCDAVKGRWVDRLAVGGELTDIVLKGNWSLSDQYPLRCRISANFVGMRIEKVLVYNSMYRLDGGHHEIWCSPLSGPGSQSVKNLRWAIEEEQILAYNNMSDSSILLNNTNTYEALCEKHIIGRDKKKFKKEIYAALSNITTPARYCNTIVTIDHFKFVGGIKKYLDTRWRTYKAKNLHWWRDSYKMLVHIERHNSTMCTTCATSKCIDTSAESGKKKIPVDPTKVFYCGRRNEECFPKNKTEVQRIKSNMGKIAGKIAGSVSTTATTTTASAFAVDAETDQAGSEI